MNAPNVVHMLQFRLTQLAITLGLVLSIVGGISSVSSNGTSGSKEPLKPQVARSGKVVAHVHPVADSYSGAVMFAASSEGDEGVASEKTRDTEWTLYRRALDGIQRLTAEMRSLTYSAIQGKIKLWRGAVMSTKHGKVHIFGSGELRLWLSVSSFS